MRKLATIQVISELRPIEGADKIEVALMEGLGWECVVKKGEFIVGDKIIYCEVDSVMPEKPEYEFLRDRKFRIRTIRLKGQISQGLVLHIDSLLKYGISSDDAYIGLDVTEILGVTKYLSPSEQDEVNQEEIRLRKSKNVLVKYMMRYPWFRKLIYNKKLKGGWPQHISKTDEERIQNLKWDEFYENYKDKEVYVTEKIDFQSVTFTGKMMPMFNGWLGKLLPKKYKFIVCSRNMTTNNKNSLYWKIAKKYNIEQILKENPTLTIQGEQGDTKVQGNKYGIKEPTMWVFNIIDYEKGYHYNYYEMKSFCDKYNLNIVPLVRIPEYDLLANYTELKSLGSTVQELVEFSKGKSVINHNVQREGIVIRCIENGKKIFSFKVLNPDFLLKYNE